MTGNLVKLFGLTVAVVMTWSCLRAPAQESASVEYKVKAAYLFNFAKFVEWPVGSFPAKDTPITLGLVGKDPFGSDLEKTFENKTIEGRALQIKRFAEGEDLRQCHILFICASERKSLPQIFEKLQGGSVLTVGEVEEFNALGGMISFITQENTIRFDIKDEAAARVGLKVSSKLLQVAKAGRQSRERSKD